MWRVAVVGAGTMGTVHARAHHANENATVVAIADIDPEAAGRVAANCGAAVYSSLDALLVNERVDVVDVCLPTDLHRRAVEQAAAAGKHVICEKPMARSLADASAMMAACRAAGVQLFIGHVVRFFPEYARARELVVGGAVGQVGTVRTVRGGVFPRASDDWYADERRSGGVIVDTIIHDFDFLRWTLGDIVRVHAKGLVARTKDHVDHAFVSLRFQSGAIGHVEGTWAQPSGFRTELEFAGDMGIVSHHSDDTVALRSTLLPSAGDAAGVLVPEEILSEKGPYARELEHFLDCLTDGRTPIITAEDAYRALEISLAALESARTGQPVTLGGGHAS